MMTTPVAQADHSHTRVRPRAPASRPLAYGESAIQVRRVGRWRTPNRHARGQGLPLARLSPPATRAATTEAQVQRPSPCTPPRTRVHQRPEREGSRPRTGEGGGGAARTIRRPRLLRPVGRQPENPYTATQFKINGRPRPPVIQPTDEHRQNRNSDHEQDQPRPSASQKPTVTGKPRNPPSQPNTKIKPSRIHVHRE